MTNPDGVISVVPMGGSAGTGEREGRPRSARARGEATKRRVQINGQLMLRFDSGWLADMAADRDASTQTWVLLYRRQEDELRAELSLPTAMTDKGVVHGWHERILLPPRSFGPEIRAPRDADGGEDVEFDVAAR